MGCWRKGGLTITIISNPFFGRIYSNSSRHCPNSLNITQITALCEIYGRPHEKIENIRQSRGIIQNAEKCAQDEKATFEEVVQM